MTLELLLSFHVNVSLPPRLGPWTRRDKRFHKASCQATRLGGLTRLDEQRPGRSLEMRPRPRASRRVHAGTPRGPWGRDGRAGRRTRLHLAATESGQQLPVRRGVDASGRGETTKPMQHAVQLMSHSLWFPRRRSAVPYTASASTNALTFFDRSVEQVANLFRSPTPSSR